MDKIDFQKKAVAALFSKLAEGCTKAGVNPNITIATRHSVTCFQLRRRGNDIDITVKQLGEVHYHLTDMRGKTSGRKIYYRYSPQDSH